MDDTVTRVARRELGATPNETSELDEGLLHETHELRVGDERYVLQFAAPALGDHRDSLARGVYWYGALADAAVPVPKVVSDGVASHGGRRYALVEAVPGETAERDVTPERARAAGAQLALLHEARSFERAGWLDVGDGEPTVEAFDGGVSGHLQRTAEESAATLREAGLDATAGVAAVADSLSAVPDDGPVVLCHDDVSPDNVCFRDGAVTGVLDFDRAYAGPAGRDLAAAATGFWMHDPGAEWPIRETLWEGYRAVRDPPASFDRLEPVYRVETLARAVAGMARLGELSAYERDYYDEALAVAVARVDRD
jgi:Ser/Thr protein kinase RdoA (MazF antagonist)